MTLGNCPHCGGSEIISDIYLQGSESLVALRYSPSFFDPGYEAVLADLCSTCGTVARIHVRNPTRKWQTAPPTEAQPKN